ncbi:MAG: trans-aconitate 2-methyltransferase [Alphaproteobacteria bacterium]
MNDPAKKPTAAAPMPWDAARYHESFGFIHRLGGALLERLDPRPGERILDLGCGTGRMAAEIAKAGATVIGLDSDPRMIEQARALHPGIEFVCANAEGFRLDGPVDAILSNAALHWMTRPQRVIKAMARALRPGGRLVLEMGGHGNVATVVDALHAALREEGVAAAALPMPWYFPRLGEYAARLERGGFAVGEAALFDRPTPLDDLENGMADWLRMFAGPFLAALPAGRHDAVIAAVVERTRPLLLQDGRWVADYRRLRVFALRAG